MVNTLEKKEIAKKLEIWGNLVLDLNKTDLGERENGFIKQIQEKSNDYQQEFARQLDELIKKVATWTFSDAFERRRVFSNSYP